MSNSFNCTLSKNDFPVDINIDHIITRTNEHINKYNNFDMSIVFVSNEEMKELNTQYSGYAKPTDVLSFEAGEIDPETGRLYLGDIVISFPFVEAQAKKLENKLVDEITLMIVHGFLHLNGFDHLTPEEKETMWLLQNRILETLNIQLNQIPE